MDFCAELAAARRETGVSQEALAARLGVPRLAITRMEAGTASVALALKVLDELKVRLNGVGKGHTLVQQLTNARLRRGWSDDDLAKRAGLDVRTVRAIERGRGTLASLARILRVVAPRAARSIASKTYWSYDKAEVARRDERFTPPHILAAMEAVGGAIALDPCDHPASPVEAVRAIQLPECGLAADWTTRGLIYVNPPFSDLSPWLTKANGEWERGAVDRMIFMLPTPRLDILAYSEGASKFATTLFLKKRLTFGSTNPAYKYPIPFSIALLFWGFHSDEIKHFRELIPAMLMPPQP